MKMLNLGCGNRFHKDWINIDFFQADKDVLQHDLNKGIPLPDKSFDIVYHSHVLEHLSQAEAKAFLKECYRVLKPNGILRVTIPDLEKIARTYLDSLEKVVSGLKDWEPNHHWMTLELYDQAVRHESGGEMARFLLTEGSKNEEFIVDRCGQTVKEIIDIGRENKENLVSSSQREKRARPFSALGKLLRLFLFSKRRREYFLRLLLSHEELTALKIGQFRLSGEIHKWMYDRYSLMVLLCNCGFDSVIQRSADESYFINWHSFNLDTHQDGVSYRPDSLYMEAIRPNI